MPRHADIILAQHAIEKVLALLQPEANAVAQNVVHTPDIDDALSKALELSAPRPKPYEEPVRTIHHLSCTGGTLLAKCIASMANVLLLNEIDFTSPLIMRGGKPAFSPTDIISLIRQGDDRADMRLIHDLFINDIALLRERQAKIGRALVLRDHSHSFFLTSGFNARQPTLYESVKARFPVKSIVSVRDPVDSYASMILKNWHEHFSPSNFDEYCRRYLVFLDRHQEIPVIKYEDFVARPKRSMQKICQLLSLDYFADFLDVFDSFSFSGDSGRKGSTIEKREQREIMPELQEEIMSSTYYVTLCGRLGYEQR